MDSVVEGQTLLLQGLGCSLEPAIQGIGLGPRGRYCTAYHDDLTLFQSDAHAPVVDRCGVRQERGARATTVG